MSDDFPQKIRDVVAEVLALEGAHSFVQYVDRRGEGVWRASGRGGDFAIRFRPTDHGRQLKTEFERMQAMASVDVAPKPVAFDEQAGWLVCAWLEGDPISPVHPPGPDDLARIASVCARMHSTGPFGGPSADQEAALNADLSRLGAANAALPEGFPVWRDRALELARRLTTGVVAAPCHNDLFPANVIVRGDQCRLIDWEYAADNDPACDLASFAVSASLGTADVETLLELYLQARAEISIDSDRGQPIDLARVHAWMLVLAVSWLPWAIADNTMPPASKAVWTEWARLRYENITNGLTIRQCEQLLEHHA